MDDVTKVSAGKLYRKQQIALWELPEPCLEQIEFSDYPNFFVTCKKTDESSNKTKMNIYPTKHEYVYYLVAKLEKIKPEILHKILSFLEENGCGIFSSTGACKKEQECYFGVYLSHTENLDLDKLKQDIKEIEGILGANMYRYTFDGCCEL